MKFRKKPVVIEAVQLREDTIVEVYEFMGIEGKGCFTDCGHGIDPEDGQFKITTLEGIHTASIGDWIIRGVKGEFYPCKPDIFAVTYEPEAEEKNYPPVLDACCGSRMFWFDKQDCRALFVDKRRESHMLPDASSARGARELVIDPDHVADFTALPFPDNTFALVVFDPPHYSRNGAKSWVGLKYGTLSGDWADMLRKGFVECFRVLRDGGTLIFKWCETEIPVSRILALTPERPLFGHKSGKRGKTHWIAFLKQDDTQKKGGGA